MLYKIYFFLCFIITTFLQANSEYKIIASHINTYACDNRQVYVFHQETWQQIDPIPVETNIISACGDSDGNLWILMPQQLANYNLAKKVWTIIDLPLSVGSISPSMFIAVGLEYWQDMIWIAAPEKLMSYKPSAQDEKWENHPYPIGIAGGQIKKGLDGRLWLNGLSNYNGQEWQILPVIPGFSFAEDEKYIFTLDGQARPWVIKENRVYFFDLLQHKWVIVANEFSFSRPTAIASFENEIWLCDYGKGIYKFVSGEWRRSSHQKTRPALEYSYELFGSKEYLWVNTYFGVGCFDGKKWASHFDYTKHDSIRTLFFSTLATIIMLLFVSILLIFIANRIKNNLLLKKLSQSRKG